mgnify:CR=1 FL=1
MTLKNEAMLIRSLLIFPGHIDRFFRKAIKSNADVIAIDLEDAVPVDQKDEARESIQFKLSNLDSDIKTFVRVNGVRTGRIERDIELSIHKNLTGFIIPMVETEEDIVFVDKIITKFEALNGLPVNKICLMPLIEQSSAVLNALSIAKASKRNIGLMFGHEDYLVNIGAPQTLDQKNILFARSAVVAAARAIKGIPIDTPYIDIDNIKGCKDHISYGKSLGFSGTLTIHPSQIDIVNTGYSPTDEEITRATNIVKEMEVLRKNGKSISYMNGSLLAPPMLKYAKQILNLRNRVLSK